MLLLLLFPIIFGLPSIDDTDRWKMAINSGEIEMAYTEQAVKVFEDGSYLAGKRIHAYYQTNRLHIDSVWSLVEVKAFAPYQYAIGGFTANGKTFQHIIITKGEEQSRELEFISEKGDTELPKAISDQRDKWMALCNAHDAGQLVRELYVNPPLYYNHRPMITAQDELIKTYGYMNRPQYNLQLTPIHVEAVNDHIVFEIGQCSGSYPGKYLLVWKKETDGQWRILLDSNI